MDDSRQLLPSPHGAPLKPEHATWTCSTLTEVPLSEWMSCMLMDRGVSVCPHVLFLISLLGERCYGCLYRCSSIFPKWHRPLWHRYCWNNIPFQGLFLFDLLLLSGIHFIISIQMYIHLYPQQHNEPEGRICWFLAEDCLSTNSLYRT